MRFTDRLDDGVARPVLWTRGQGCSELADLLGDVESIRATGDLVEACIRHRAELLVSRRLSGGFDLVNSAAPIDADLESAGAVVAAAAGGPHSLLAVKIAARLAQRLDVGAMVVSAYESEADKGRAVHVIERLQAEVPTVEYRMVEAGGAGELVADLPDKSLLVIGAPGGGWLQRTFFGPGAKLRSEATVGAVVVRRQPDRVFQVMSDPVFVGPYREAIDIIRLHPEPVLAVVDRAQLIGIVRRDALELADPGMPVQSLMEPPVSVLMTASVESAMAVAPRLRGASLPVVDDDGRLVGALLIPA